MAAWAIPNPYTFPEDGNSHDDDPYNRVGMTQWSEETPAFKIIQILANLRQERPAIAQGDYRTLYADQDILVFERRDQHELVIVAVNRGDDLTIAMSCCAGDGGRSRRGDTCGNRIPTDR
jgi:hypothetical protein